MPAMTNALTVPDEGGTYGPRGVTFVLVQVSRIEVNAIVYRLLATPVIGCAPHQGRAHLTNVSADGTFFLQIHGFGLRELQRLTLEPEGKENVKEVSRSGAAGDRMILWTRFDYR